MDENLNANLLIHIEKKAMELLMAGDDPLLCKLREQYSSAKIAFSKFTGAGFYSIMKLEINL